ncbi:MAG: hypothetical protein JXR97_07215, partial [Planctomycetes bacterium]|nr:hypothetical protein [Planctomycetota bacterium]
MIVKTVFNRGVAAVLLVAALLCSPALVMAAEGEATTPSNVPNPVDQNMKFMQDLFGNAMSGGGAG